jgi:hypothetical protein
MDWKIKRYGHSFLAPNLRRYSAVTSFCWLVTNMKEKQAEHSRNDRYLICCPLASLPCCRLHKWPVGAFLVTISKERLEAVHTGSHATTCCFCQIECPSAEPTKNPSPKARKKAAFFVATALLAEICASSVRLGTVKVDARLRFGLLTRRFRVVQEDSNHQQLIPS